MTQHDYNIANQTFPSYRSDHNNSLTAIASQNAGTTAPTTTFENLAWIDTTDNLVKRRNSANTAWITIQRLDKDLGFATSSGSPSGVITPIAKGEIIVDTTNNVLYHATGLTNTDWSRVAQYTDTQVIDRTAITTLEDTDHLLIADNSDSDANKKITIANFKTEAGSIWNFISKATISDPTTNIIFDNTVITSTYDYYKFIFSNIRLNTDNKDFCLVFSEDNGSTWSEAAGDYAWSAGGGYGKSTSDTQIHLTAALGNLITSPQEKAFGEVLLHHPLATDSYCEISTTLCFGIYTATFFGGGGAGVYKKNKNAINALKFFGETGTTFASGEVSLFGIKNS